MPNTRSSRTTRSNSNPQNNITLADITKLLENHKADLLASLNSRFDEIASRMTKIINRMNNIDQMITQVELRCTQVEEASEKLFSSITQEIEDRNHRRLNLIVSGIPEGEGCLEERKSADKEKIETLLGDLDDEWDDDVIEHVHRIGNNVSKGPRLIRVTCSGESVKKDILRRAKQLRNLPVHSNVYINPDLTLQQRDENKRLRNEVKARRSQGENVMIRNGKIVERRNIENFH